MINPNKLKWPWPTLSKLQKGVKRGELICLMAGRLPCHGGKSIVTRELRKLKSRRACDQTHDVIFFEEGGSHEHQSMHKLLDRAADYQLQQR